MTGFRGLPRGASAETEQALGGCSRGAVEANYRIQRADDSIKKCTIIFPSTPLTKYVMIITYTLGCTDPNIAKALTNHPILFHHSYQAIARLDEDGQGSSTSGSS